MLNPGDEIGKYLILEMLGSGHFGTVYKALDRALSVERALKVLPVADPTKFVELFEAQFQHKCRHDNCVAVNGADVQTIGAVLHAIIDMELVTGGSIESRIARGFLSCKQACMLVCDASYGLEHAHTQGVLHKDIKPGNILVDNGIAKIADFGISEPMAAPSPASGKVYTTHQPPEYFSSGAITVQSDVYSLGMTLFRCVNNVADWSHCLGSVPNLIQSLTKGSLIKDIGWQPWVPDRLRKIISKACATLPAKRYKSVREFRQALEKLSWNLDWVRSGALEWDSAGTPQHSARIVGKALDTFEHLVSGRRRKSETRSFATTADAMEFMLEFVATTTLQA